MVNEAMSGPKTEIPSRVLIVRLGAIGDVVNALVVAAALKQARPAPSIGWVVHDLASPLLRGNPCVDRVHVWPRASGLGGLRALLRELRRERYELAIDLQRLAKSSLLARLSGAPRVLGFDRARCKEFSWLPTTERIPPADPHAHMVVQYMEFAAALGLGEPKPVHPLPSDEQANTRAEVLLAEMGAAPILVNLGASKPANRWPEPRFAQLARRLANELAVPVCVTGGPADRDLFASTLESLNGATGVTDLVGRTSLLELHALAARSRLFVGCDTGPMHLSAASGLTCVVLFGPADPGRTGPFGAGHRIVRVPPACAPCNLKHCNQTRHACMEDISVDLVLSEVKAALSPA